MSSCSFDIKLRSVAKAIPALLELRKLIAELSDDDKKFLDKIVANHYSISLSDLAELRENPISTIETISNKKVPKQKKQTAKVTKKPPDSGVFYTVLELAEQLDTSMVEIRRLLRDLDYVNQSTNAAGNIVLELAVDGLEFGKLNDKKQLVFHESILDILKACHYIIAD